MQEQDGRPLAHLGPVERDLAQIDVKVLLFARQRCRNHLPRSPRRRSPTRRDGGEAGCGDDSAAPFSSGRGARPPSSSQISWVRSASIFSLRATSSFFVTVLPPRNGGCPTCGAFPASSGVTRAPTRRTSPPDACTAIALAVVMRGLRMRRDRDAAVAERIGLAGYHGTSIVPRDRNVGRSSGPTFAFLRRLLPKRVPLICLGELAAQRARLQLTGVSHGALTEGAKNATDLKRTSHLRSSQRDRSDEIRNDKSRSATRLALSVRCTARQARPSSSPSRWRCSSSSA